MIYATPDSQPFKIVCESLKNCFRCGITSKNGSSIPTLGSSIVPKPVIEITSNKITYFWRLDKDYLEREYIKNGKSMAQIAREKSCARSTIGAALRKSSICRSTKPENSLSGQVPYGFRLEYGVLVQHKSERQVIDQMIGRRASGDSYGKIADWLNSEEIKTKNKTKAWDRVTVFKILRRYSSPYELQTSHH